MKHIKGQPVTIVEPAAGLVDGVVFIDVAHNEVHEGHTFQASYKSPDASDIADNGTIRMILITGTRYAHLEFSVIGGGDAELSFYEAPAYTGGTALLASNMNRNGTMTPTTAARHTPTVTNTGQRLHNSLIPGGTGGGAGATPGAVARADTEWILKPNTAYLIEGINRAGSAQPMSITAQWYEEE